MNNTRSYTAELLPNGYYRLFCYASKLSGLYHQDGKHHGGDLILSQFIARSIITAPQPTPENPYPISIQGPSKNYATDYYTL